MNIQFHIPSAFHIPFVLDPTAEIGESSIAEFAGIWLLAGVLVIDLSDIISITVEAKCLRYFE